MSPAVQIDCISIRVPGVDRDLGMRLGQLVAAQLVPSLQLGPGETSLERLHLELTAQTAEDPELLAGRIATQVSLLLGAVSALEAGR
jgi:hypothetical protein